MAYYFTTESVDAEFAGRALEAQYLRGESLLRAPRPTDHTVLYADGEDSYELLDPSVSWEEVASRTYREEAEWQGYDSFEAYCEDYGECDPDQPMEPDVVAESVSPGDTPAGSASDALWEHFKLIGPTGAISGHEVILGQSGSSFFDAALCEALNKIPPELRHGPYPLGWVINHDGPMPGSNYRGVEVSGPVALSCLQHVLDRAESGIRLELAPPDFDQYPG